MKIIIKSQSLALPAELKDLIETKFYGLEKFIESLKRPDEIGKTLAEVFVEVEKETKRRKRGDIYRVKSRIYLPGREIVSKVRTDDLQKAIVKAKHDLKLEIEKYKGRKIALHDKRARRLKTIVRT